MIVNLANVYFPQDEVLMLSVSFLVRLKGILLSANALRVVFDLCSGEISRKPQKLAKTISAFSGFLPNFISF